MTKKTVVIVEDDPDIKRLLEIKIGELHQVISFSDGQKAKDFIEAHRSASEIDLFLLDRMLPYVSGEELCFTIRSHKGFQNHPILLLTALSSKQHIVQGLDSGADDYLCKPFDLTELMARVRSLLRRGASLKKTSHSLDHLEFVYKGLVLSPQRARVSIEGKKITLTKSEYLLLLGLMKKPGDVLSRDELMKIVQGENTHVTRRTIDTHMTSLRKKIKPYGQAIETVRGIGYRFVQ